MKKSNKRLVEIMIVVLENTEKSSYTTDYTLAM